MRLRLLITINMTSTSSSITSSASHMATPQPLPLQERVHVDNTLQRILDLLILSLLVSLLYYRLSSLHSHGFTWLIAFLCECWFTFVWVLYVNAKWNPVMYKTYPERLTKRFDELPAVDMFVTTADPKLEPPIVTVNTVLSLLAVEYPVDKLACYVSDDGCSPITFYALSEASKFAKLWVPFCKRYCIRVRAPFVYFSQEPDPSGPQSSPEFIRDWKQIKSEYEDLCGRIENGGTNYVPYHLNDELADFSNIERGDHHSIVKVIWDNKELKDGFPHLVYVSREKRPKHHHHFKAGAMNVLTRVSAVMTNAPFLLNVDCDMFANNPEILLHGMCLLLGFEKEVFSGFVQTMQQFYGSLKDDPFGNQLVVLQHKLGMGIGGIQGPFYGGTGCFHRRKVIYGLQPVHKETNRLNGLNDELSNEELQKNYGNSKYLMESVDQIISRRTNGIPILGELSRRIEEAKRVASCTYEFNTCWGKEIGWVYGSLTEDVLTGLRIHTSGWRSVYCTPEPPAFLGSAPSSGPSSLTQYKRWATGLLEILFGKHSPLLATFTKQLLFRECLAYLVILVWALRSVVELCYALLPAYCLLTNTSFLPKASELEIIIPIALFTIVNISSLIEYLQCGLSVRAWWNNQRMQIISSCTAWLFGFLSVILKIMGLSETMFEVTPKEQNKSDDSVDVDPGRFTFDSSPMFVPGTAIVLLHLMALTTGLLRASKGGLGPGIGEFVCSIWVLISLWPFVRGLFGRGDYGIPWSVIWRAIVVVYIFLQLCNLGRVWF